MRDSCEASETLRLRGRRSRRRSARSTSWVAGGAARNALQRSYNRLVSAPASADDVVEIRLLGPFEVVRNGSAVGLGTRKQRAALQRPHNRTPIGEPGTAAGLGYNRANP